ncbi:hypothetical protein [Trinickia dabaoshanensis]|uniref:hypothetical protein n=1 Tax=Trinickia dabaoshanensis TaxID=564714 RepID=UPI0011AF3339|nr:hypothetical protein [Trinickia dabaoshanensis]
MEKCLQQAFLRRAKDALGLTWDELAGASGISPRALKTYRMPETSQDHRTLPNLSRAAIERLVQEKPGKRAKHP